MKKEVTKISRSRIEKIKKRFGTVTDFAKYMGVHRSRIYEALGDNPHMKKLKARIVEELKKESRQP